MERRPTRPAPVFANGRKRANDTPAPVSTRDRLTRLWQMEAEEPRAPQTDRKGVVGWTKKELPTRADITARIAEKNEAYKKTKAPHPLKDVVIDWKRHRCIGHLKGRKYRVAVTTKGAWVESKGLEDLWVPRPEKPTPATPTTEAGPTATSTPLKKTPQTSQ